MKILCFGDSNTYGFDPRSYFGGRYDEDSRWTDIFAVKAGCTLINMGQNGLSIPSSEYKAKLYDKIFSTESPDILIVMLGSNDLLSGMGADSVAARMKRFLNQLTFSKNKILLVSPPSFKEGTWVDSESTINHSKVLGEKYGLIAQSLGINFVDADLWNTELCYDGVHFTAKGHKAFADGIYNAMTKLLTKEK